MKITAEPVLTESEGPSNRLSTLEGNVHRRASQRMSRRSIIIESIPEEIRDRSMRMLFDPDGTDYKYDSTGPWELLEKSAVST